VQLVFLAHINYSSTDKTYKNLQLSLFVDL
jgi:hypothetical protein